MASLSKGKAKRKTFVAREDLLDRLAGIAEQKGYSLYAFVNDIFELAVRAEEVGVNLKRFLEDYMAVKRARDAGFILEPERLCYVMADIAYERSRSRVAKEWFESGVWFAKRYILGSGDNCWEDFKRDLKALLWNVQEFEIEQKGDGVSVRVLSPRFSEAYTCLFEAFLEGCLDAFGYKSTVKEVFRGRILLEAAKAGEGAEGR
ncbi:MAG: hypothetical protein N3F10_03245 [Candidatus Bathyarchaeota archaeon]|nr:hypothetical protein [Candidatus Bathyarchaeota archaeon]